MAPPHIVTVLEQSQVAPPPGTVADSSVPLSFLDIPWLSLPPVQILLFYDFPHSKAYFIETLIPNLKHSLSLTLKHFFPLAGNLIYPTGSSTSKPVIRFVDGNSVSVTFAESSNYDYSYLTGNHARNARAFYPLAPQLPRATAASDAVVVPLVAVQVTLFPNEGICVAFTLRHLAGDFRSWMHFINSWASVTKFQGDAKLLADKTIPVFERSMIKDPTGLEVIFLNQMGEARFEYPQFVPGDDMVRATFIFRHADVKRLKGLVLSLRPTLSRVSTFSVACAYIWICMMKTRNSEKVRADDIGQAEVIATLAECRGRLDPPIPATYFGNCLVPCHTTAKTDQQMAGGGLITAAELIGEGIRNRLQGEEGVLKGLNTWISDFERSVQQHYVGVSGSPKFTTYTADFGWGNPKKFEPLAVDDMENSFYIGHCRDSEDGAFEVSLFFPKVRMDAFATLFADGLKDGSFFISRL
ncbi:hypothetical protein RJ639_022225 [Escallonia herrerae]|uniref:Uncharacterized protein n=1 Tax=Escallonia herrerae TaxID=1293975 RepID=A0AA89AG76_9ASTE|nr:hypothetical protein RJ639_022225 [Escallonia herrerae]